MAAQRRVGWLAGVLAAMQLLHGALSTPVGDTQLVLQAHAAGSDRKLHGRFLHISDLHPDDFYKVHSSTEEGTACHRGKGPAGTYGAETSDCDSPFALINATLQWIADNLRDEVDFVVWTGDSARHDSDELIPRSEDQVLGTNRKVAEGLIKVFTDPKDESRLLVPIIPTLGNNDILPHNILLPGPNKWLQTYTDIWRRFIPEEQRHSFEFGGWFYVEVIPNQLAVFSLNTLYLFDRNAGVDDCATPSEPGFKQMEWLHVQLEFMRQRGMKAILMGHVPPARTASKLLWDETCWQKYTLWLRQYRDVITGAVYGHMNIDHFLVQDTKDIDLNVVAGGEPTTNLFVREAMESELSVASSADYLQELRQRWADISIKTSGLDEEDVEASQGKGKKSKKPKKPKTPYKDIGGRWAERYQVSLVSPSIIPNYFPSLRIVEYNITGLEDAPVWLDEDRADDDEAINVTYPIDMGDEAHEELKRDLETERKKHKKHKKKKSKKPKKPKDPNLVIPDPPAKTAPPGPAYSPQPLTLTGYTQYFANLTYINNDMTHDEVDGEDVASGQKWRDGMHRDKMPKRKKPKPHEFKFEVEYATFNDSTYKLPDLTVKSFVRLAYRMARDAPKGSAYLDDFEEDEEAVEDEDVELVDDNEDEDEVDDIHEETKGGKGKKGKKGKKDKKKKKKKKHHKKRNKVWMTFLTRAFVSSVDKKELKDLV